MCPRLTGRQPEQRGRRRPPLPPRKPRTPSRRPPPQNLPNRSGAASPCVRLRAASPAATTIPMNPRAACGFQREHRCKGGSMRRYFWSLSPLVLVAAACATIGDDGSCLVAVDHYVRVKSTAPAFAGRDALIYVREVAGPLREAAPASARTG